MGRFREMHHSRGWLAHDKSTVRSGVMVKDGGVLARAISIGPRAATGVSADAASGIPRYGITRRGRQ
jgi:hypothetical protein